MRSALSTSSPDLTSMSGCCGAVLADTPLQHCMEVGDSTSGVANQGGVVVPLFKKGDRRVCSNYRRDHTSQPPREGLRQGTGEENSAYSRPWIQEEQCGFRPGRGTQWTSSIPSTGCWRVYGSLPNQSTCALWIWRRHSTVSLVVFCGECSMRFLGVARGRRESRFGNHRISSLLFADDVVLLASSSQDLQHVLERFAAECEAAGMRISTSKSEAMVLDRKRVACPLRVGGEVLPQVEEFKYLGVLFTSEGKMEREIDRRIGAASAVMRSVYRTVVVKKELSRKAKLSIYRSIYVPTLTYGHELWVMTERTRSLDTSGRNEFPPQGGWLPPLEIGVRSSVTREELGVEPLLLRIERSQLRWLGHLASDAPLDASLRRCSRRVPPGEGPWKTQDTLERLCLSAGLGNALGIPPEELEEVSGVREVWASLLRLLPPRPGPGPSG
ncbi:hypothetical protein L3Q82_014864 [Scortum barcoo]|uniref:Uncharacterized protein n=1 Tax=Scortum barcoo TaxID=214431 RepID=A0ACB8VSI0_9TELE|nr:hypothetical protein L3Q82_014864 [Scortum barcoo]